MLVGMLEDAGVDLGACHLIFIPPYFDALGLVWRRRCCRSAVPVAVHLGQNSKVIYQITHLGAHLISLIDPCWSTRGACLR